MQRFKNESIIVLDMNILLEVRTYNSMHISLDFSTT